MNVFRSLPNFAVFLVACLLLVFCSQPVSSQTVFFDDFDGGQLFGSGVTGGIAGIVSVESGQGLQGLGNTGNTFSGNIARQNLAVNTRITLTLNGLPPHDMIEVDFLFAPLDTWDGTDVFPGFPSPDFFNVMVDGELVFQESFRNSTREDDANCTKGEICQSYLPPPNVLICTGGEEPFGDVGFGGGKFSMNAADGAYDMYLDPQFQIIAHTGSTLSLEFYGSGGGNQDILDESIGIDNLQITTYILGDVNCDGAVNLLDVAPFIDAISSGTYVSKADINRDGSVDLLDVAPFVELLAG